MSDDDDDQSTPKRVMSLKKPLPPLPPTFLVRDSFLRSFPSSSPLVPSHEKADTAAAAEEEESGTSDLEEDENVTPAPVFLTLEEMAQTQQQEKQQKASLPPPPLSPSPPPRLSISSSEEFPQLLPPPLPPKPVKYQQQPPSSSKPPPQLPSRPSFLPKPTSSPINSNNNYVRPDQFWFGEEERNRRRKSSALPPLPLKQVPSLFLGQQPSNRSIATEQQQGSVSERRISRRNSGNIAKGTVARLASFFNRMGGGTSSSSTTDPPKSSFTFRKSPRRFSFRSSSSALEKSNTVNDAN